MTDNHHDLHTSSCDPRRPLPGDPSLYFDHSRFTSFLYLKSQREKQMRKLYRRQGKTLPWLSLDFYTDDILHDEFSSIYGEMDKSNSIYSKIFATYKEDRLEEITEWIDEEKEMINQLLLDGGKLVDPSYQIPTDQLIEPLSNFSSKELEAYQQVTSMSNFAIERFHLPRPPLENQVPGSQLQRLISPHVTGILLEVLFQQFKTENKDCKVPEFIQMVLQLSPCPWSQEVPLAKAPFLYPAPTSGLLCTPRELFRNIFHKVQVLLALSNGVLPVDEIAGRFQSLFKFQLTGERLKAWDFPTVTKFLKVLLQMFDPCDMSVVSSTELSISNPADTHYLIHNEKLGKFLKTKGYETGNGIQVSNGVEFVPKLHLAKLPLPPTPSSVYNQKQIIRSSVRIPLDCMQVGERIESVSRSLPLEGNKRKEFQCVLLNYFNPTDFYVALAENWDRLERFQTHLTATYAGLVDSSCPEIQVKEELLTRGLYVVVLQVEDSGKDYLRGEYIEKRFDGTHKIFLADYGEYVNVSSSAIFYLRKCLAHELGLQAIWCGIYNILPQEHWDQRITDLCYEMIGNTSSRFIVKFMNSIQFQGRGQWFVKASGTNRKKFPDVGGALQLLLPSLNVTTGK